MSQPPIPGSILCPGEFILDPRPLTLPLASQLGQWAQYYYPNSPPDDLFSELAGHPSETGPPDALYLPSYFVPAGLPTPSSARARVASQDISDLAERAQSDSPMQMVIFGPVGSGHFGSVHYGALNNTHVAVKVVPVPPISCTSPRALQLVRECLCAAVEPHRNLCQIYIGCMMNVTPPYDLQQLVTDTDELRRPPPDEEAQSCLRFSQQPTSPIHFSNMQIQESPFLLNPISPTSLGSLKDMSQLSIRPSSSDSPFGTPRPELPSFAAYLQNNSPANGNVYLIVQEYCDGGTLTRLLTHARAAGTPLPLQDTLMILLQLGRALRHLHHRNIIHRDIKPDNILFTSRQSLVPPLVRAQEQLENQVCTKCGHQCLCGITQAGEPGCVCCRTHPALVEPPFKPPVPGNIGEFRLKLCDYGLTRHTDARTGLTMRRPGMTVGAGTKLWMAPECVRRDGQYGMSVDIFSWGVVALELLTLQLPSAMRQPAAPFQSEALQQLLTSVPAEGHPGVRAQINRLVIASLSTDARQRPTAENIVDTLRQCSLATVEVKPQAPIPPPMRHDA